MAETLEKATRQSYGEALVELGHKHDDFIVMDADLASATKTGLFKAEFPERFLDVGVAEQNLMGVAAGIATTGHKVFASSFAMFAAGRAFDQIRNSIGYPHLHVVIGATHAGISVGEDGASHQCNEDIALMRVIPGMTVICPSDDRETKQAVEAAYNAEGPVYLRLGRLAVPAVHSDDYHFQIGKATVEKQGTDITVVATGLMVTSALQAAKQLENEGISCEVINMATTKPLDKDTLLASAKKTGHVVTVEEHSVIGGLGSAVCDVLSETMPTPVKKLGMQDTFGESGPAVELLHKYQLDGEGIAASIKQFAK
ncbi:transketolase family protein [Atopobium sp. oral taxon 416]|uniref:transketolase family protein n=1 Tax=Atopobium sp. oral taxon 416 TaxID=712157 RepID=UPI001BAA606D|nr:transketolase family protein [Atopobium sp. oral taxon 416]QUC02319.1 transketolase family protein [Atopobium sp. oral taxon 416]